MKRRITKNKLLLGILWCQLFFVFSLNAQETTSELMEVTGKVIDEFDVPMPYVNVYVKGTKSGTLTDFDGNFSIKAVKGQVLVFSYIGYKSIEKPITDSSSISIALEPDTSELSEVVVTALGIKKEKKAIGYAVDAISAEESTRQGTQCAVKSFCKSAWGSSIRFCKWGGRWFSKGNYSGVTSLSSDNQPLYVLDGLPLLSNRSLSESLFTSSTGQSDLGGNPLSDINPNDIENISILKGASATALYGARGGANGGVIMITTKKGKSGQKGWGG